MGYLRQCLTREFIFTSDLPHWELEYQRGASILYPIAAFRAVALVSIVLATFFISFVYDPTFTSIELRPTNSSADCGLLVPASDMWLENSLKGGLVTTYSLVDETYADQGEGQTFSECKVSKVGVLTFTMGGSVFELIPSWMSGTDNATYAVDCNSSRASGVLTLTSRFARLGPAQFHSLTMDSSLFLGDLQVRADKLGYYPKGGVYEKWNVKNLTALMNKYLFLTLHVETEGRAPVLRGCLKTSTPSLFVAIASCLATVSVNSPPIRLLPCWVLTTFTLFRWNAGRIYLQARNSRHKKTCASRQRRGWF